jgi:hypothetical protein
MDDFDGNRSGEIEAGDTVQFIDPKKGSKLWMALEVFSIEDDKGDRVLVGELDEFECSKRKSEGGDAQLPLRKELRLVRKGKFAHAVLSLADFLEWCGNQQKLGDKRFPLLTKQEKSC